MVVQQTGVLEINYCPCKGCDRTLVELEKFPEVQQIDRDAEKHKASILVTGDLYKVTKLLRKPNNSNRSGGRFGEILKTVCIFLGKIIGILVGDPTGALMPVLIEFVLSRLPKSLIWLLVCIACWVKVCGVE